MTAVARRPKTCAVKAHVRTLPDRLDTAKHRQLASELNWKLPRKIVRVKAGRRVQ